MSDKAIAENRRLIVVDDEKDIVQAYLDFLAPAEGTAPRRSSRSAGGAASGPAEPVPGYEILTALSGADAIDLVRKELAAGRRIAGGFFDVKMEGAFDGIQAIQEIWKLDPDLHCTVVTAYHDRNVDDIDQLFGARFKDQWDYLNKPFTQAEIVQKARQMVAAWNRRRSLEDALEKVKSAQAQLIESERLAAIGQVARGIHHEFGNFLQTIVGQADLASSESDPKKVREKLTTILHAAERAAVIVRNLKSFSRAGDSRSSVDLPKLLHETTLLLTHEFRRRKIEIVERFSACSPLLASSAEIEQVFLNLMINAVHAMPSGGKIEIGCCDDGATLCGWVKDGGTGIPPEVLPRIFDYAFTTKGEKGSGLGLAICKQVVESHGGRIAVETELGKGTSFRLSFPATRQGDTPA